MSDRARKHVAVLLGGFSSERPVSLMSGGACADVSVSAGGAQVNDLVIFGLQAGATLPSRFIALPGRVDSAGVVMLRFCNIGTATQSFSSLNVHILTMR